MQTTWLKQWLFEVVRELEDHALSWPLKARVSRTASQTGPVAARPDKFLKKADESPDNLMVI